MNLISFKHCMLDNETLFSVNYVKVEFEINNVLSDTITCIREFTNNVIALGCMNGSFTLIKINLISKTWKQIFTKLNAHNGCIFSLCEIQQSHLASSSEDSTIKIWKIEETTLNLIKTISNHTDIVLHLININENTFVSCSYDKTIRLWSISNSFQEELVMMNDSVVCSILCLSQRKDVLVAGCENSVIFWDINVYVKLSTVKYVYVFYSSHMIELQNGCVSVSSNSHPDYPIVIIDALNYTIMKSITLKDCFSECSSLCTYGEKSFIYLNGDVVIQVSIDDNNVIYKGNSNNNIDGSFGVIYLQKEKYYLVTNCSKGISVINII